MKRVIASTLAVAIALTAASAADAHQGCDPGFHRGPHGHCRPNHNPGVGRPVLIIGHFYPGRG